LQQSQSDVNEMGGRPRITADKEIDGGWSVRPRNENAYLTCGEDMAVPINGLHLRGGWSGIRSTRTLKR